MPSVLLTIKRLAKTLFPKYSPPMEQHGQLRDRPENDIGLPQDVREEQLPELPEASGI